MMYIDEQLSKRFMSSIWSCLIIGFSSQERGNFVVESRLIMLFCSTEVTFEESRYDASALPSPRKAQEHEH
jgi:hypothetical protein